MIVRYVFLAALAIGGCGGDGAGRTSFEVGSDPTVSASGMTMTESDSDGSGSGKDTKNESDSDPTGMDTESGSDSDDTGSGSDTDDGSTTTGLNIVPCVGVDVLFVIDNSTAMADEQTRLVATANAFIDQFVPAVPTAMGDVNIGVITTDAAELVVPIDGATMMPTTYSSGQNYMTYSTLMLTPTELTTALTVGEGGDVNERPMDFLIEAISGDVAHNGGFNDGFLREDALLVVVLLTDEEDDVEEPTLYGSDGDPPAWIEAVASVKQGIKRDIAILSIIPTDGGCTDDDGAPRLAEFTESFGHGATADVCEPEYATFLIGRIPDLAEACNNFAPP